MLRRSIHGPICCQHREQDRLIPVLAAISVSINIIGKLTAYHNVPISGKSLQSYSSLSSTNMTSLQLENIYGVKEQRRELSLS